jgi:hypothetical protein
LQGTIDFSLLPEDLLLNVRSCMPWYFEDYKPTDAGSNSDAGAHHFLQGTNKSNGTLSDIDAQEEIANTAKGVDSSLHRHKLRGGKFSV